MPFDAVNVVVAGLAGTVEMTAVITMGGAVMGIKMDMPLTLGTMFVPKGVPAWTVGLMLHLMMGVVFFLAYALLFQWFGLSSHLGRWGAAFGVGHATVAGVAFGVLPALHPRMAAAGAAAGAGTIPAPGFFGAGLGGMAPMAVILAHVVFGLTAGWIYAALA